MKKKEQHKDFKIPEEYLEGFTTKLMDKLPKEDPATDTDGFKVPEKYFDGLYDSLTKKLGEEEDTKIIPLHKQNKTLYYAIAGVAAAILMVFGMIFMEPKTITFEDLAASDIENYFDVNVNELDSYELAEAISESDLEILSITETTIEDSAIIEYLDTNTSDFEDLNLLDYEQ
ncbi:hypothetical protein [Spongiimicrobium salis]|uniref:hypothetical protein n=1 Tax=Spongiimicrobium salis TaxID=1667022 RepID=UPI00374CC752